MAGGEEEEEEERGQAGQGAGGTGGGGGRRPPATGEEGEGGTFHEGKAGITVITYKCIIIYLPKSKPDLMLFPMKARPHRRLSQPALDLVAARFRLLGEPTRLRLLSLLEPGEKTVSELVEASGANQANVSRHLQMLTEAGLLSRRKDGLNVCYRIADPSVFDLCEHVCGSLQQRLAAQANAFER